MGWPTPCPFIGCRVGRYTLADQAIARVDADMVLERSRPERWSMRPSLPPPAKTMAMRDGSSTRESGRSTASRPMSEQMGTSIIFGTWKHCYGLRRMPFGEAQDRDGEVSPKPPSKPTSPPSPTTSSAPSTFSRLKHEDCRRSDQSGDNLGR